MRTTGHKTRAILDGYVRIANVFVGTSAPIFYGAFGAQHHATVSIMWIVQLTLI